MEFGNGTGRAQLGLRIALAMSLSWVMIVADSRYGNVTAELRSRIAELVVAPARFAAQLPTAAWTTTSDYLKSRDELIETKVALEEELLRERTRNSLLLQAEVDNRTLRRLLEARMRVEPDAILAEVVNTASLPFINRIVLDKGQAQGVRPGQGVFNDEGVVGQLTRVDTDTSQALLLTDKRFWVATRMRRGGSLVLLQGDGGGRLRLRFVPSDVDVDSGDVLVTAGGVGPFPAGLPVAEVVSVWQPDGVPFQEGFARPVASIRQDTAVLVHSVAGEEQPDAALPLPRSGVVPAHFDPQPLP